MVTKNPPTSSTRSSTRRKTTQSLLADLAASAQAKAAESLALRRSTLEANTELLNQAATELARRFAPGDGCSPSETAAAAPIPPPGEAVRPAPDRNAATRLVVDRRPGDHHRTGQRVGFELVFARQLIARAKAGDIAVAMSTSGNSPNLLTALAEARQRGLYTVGFAGYDGGAFANNPNVDACFIVRSQSVHRIQESQALLGYQLWLATHERFNDLGLGAA